MYLDLRMNLLSKNCEKAQLKSECMYAQESSCYRIKSSLSAWLFQDLRNIHCCIWALSFWFDLCLYSRRKGQDNFTQRNDSLTFNQLSCSGEWSWLQVLPWTRLLKSLWIAKSMSCHVLKSHIIVLFADQMHHWGIYFSKYKERSSAQNRHRKGFVSTSLIADNDLCDALMKGRKTSDPNAQNTSLWRCEKRETALSTSKAIFI